jgi:diguanylate cyclase (GGDEF)-like protein
MTGVAVKGGPAQQSLAGRLLLFAFGSTLLGALVVSWVAIDSTRRSQQEVVARTHPAALARASTQITEWIEAGWAATESIGSRVGPGRPSEALQRLAEQHPELRTLAWVDIDPVRTQASDGLPASLAGTGLRELVQRRVPALLPVDLRGSDSTLAAWLPRKSGGVLALFEPGLVEGRLSAQLPNPDSVLVLVDAAGHPLFCIKTPDSLTPIEIDLGALRGAPGELREYAMADVGMLATAVPIGLPSSPGWHLALQTPFASAHAPMLALVKRVLGVAASVILVVCLFAYRLSARALRPIELLSAAARRVGRGEPDVELPAIRSRDEVGILTEAFGEMLEQIRQHRSQIEAANRDLVDRNARLESANEVLGQLSITDGLTQLHNHRFFQDQLTREIKRITRSGESLAMLILDIDDFKKLNDRFGHAAGDEVLCRIARLLEQNVRESDLVVRYGGEEFVVLASNTDLAGASVLGEKVRTVIAENSFIVDDSLRPIRVTVSVGVAQYAGNRKRFFSEADEALYRAKGAGKNCVMVAD